MNLKKPAEGGDHYRDILLLDEKRVYKHTVGISQVVKNALHVEDGDKVQYWLIANKVVIRKKLKHPSHEEGDY